VIGDQCPQAVGYAMGMQHDDADSAVMVFFGDGASSQGDVNESFIWASVFNAPVVFFCQNNQWAISEPLERQTRIPLFQRAWGFGFPGVRVDGNDVLACLAVSKHMLQRAREGAGPALVEAFTYRMGAHTTSDDPTRYRLDTDVEAWRLRDPLERVRSFLHKQQLVDDAYFAELDAEAEQLAERLRVGVRSLPDPGVEAMFEHAYAEPHSLVERQRDAYNGYLAGFATEDAR
jgi:pyruvate dehydrogenase E1 component alpha subunit